MCYDFIARFERSDVGPNRLYDASAIRARYNILSGLESESTLEYFLLVKQTSKGVCDIILPLLSRHHDNSRKLRGALLKSHLGRVPPVQLHCPISNYRASHCCLTSIV